jgi:hypothetical protein
MSDDASKNGGPRGGTSRGDPPRDPLHGPDLSEARFLNREAEAAKAAIVECLRNLEKDIKAALWLVLPWQWPQNQRRKARLSRLRVRENRRRRRGRRSRLSPGARPC